MCLRTGLSLLACCAALTEGTAAPPKGPAATVTTPAVDRPPAPASAEEATASEAFTAYADLGAAANDGLAPGDTYDALHTACMDDAGYGPYAASTPFSVRTTRRIGPPQPSFGLWGYIGLSLAEQYGANASSTPPPGSSATSVPSEAQAATGKCLNIVQAFSNAQSATSTAVIETMNGDISNALITDRYLTKAQQAWTACMARNGYNAVQPDTIWRQYFLDGIAVLVESLGRAQQAASASSTAGAGAGLSPAVDAQLGVHAAGVGLHHRLRIVACCFTARSMSGTPAAVTAHAPIARPVPDQASRTDAVRACPWFHPSGHSRARTTCDGQTQSAGSGPPNRPARWC